MKEPFEIMLHINLIMLRSVKSFVGYVRVECRFHIT